MTAYTLFSGDAHGLALISDTGPYTLGVQFGVSETIPLTGIKFYSGSGALDLPSQCVIFDADTETEVAGTLNTSPSWSGAAGSGYVKCAYDGSVSLSPGINYAVAVFGDPGADWYSGINGYWTSGGGGSGITDGPLSAPASSGALHGQAIYNSGSSLAFPATTTSGYDFGVDVEVTPAAVVPLFTQALTVALEE